MSNNQEKIAMHAKMQKNTIWRDKASITNRYDKDAGIIRPGIKNNYEKYVRAIMDKVDSMQDHMGK